MDKVREVGNGRSVSSLSFYELPSFELNKTCKKDGNSQFPIVQLILPDNTFQLGELQLDRQCSFPYLKHRSSSTTRNIGLNDIESANSEEEEENGELSETKFRKIVMLTPPVCNSTKRMKCLQVCFITLTVINIASTFALLTPAIISRTYISKSELTSHIPYNSIFRFALSFPVFIIGVFGAIAVLRKRDDLIFFFMIGVLLNFFGSLYFIPCFFYAVRYVADLSVLLVANSIFAQLTYEGIYFNNQSYF